MLEPIPLNPPMESIPMEGGVVVVTSHVTPLTRPHTQAPEVSVLTTAKYREVEEECVEHEEIKGLFRLRNGMIEREGTNRSCKEWFGCSSCGNRWFEKLSQLESHYGREHDGAKSYKFELLELKNCVIALPYVTPRTTPVHPRLPLKERYRDTEQLNVHFSALTLSHKDKSKIVKPRKLSIRKTIRQAIKATQVDTDGGSSYRRIKAHLLTNYGMDPAKLHKKLRGLLEHFVELNKLERKFSRGKTLYSIQQNKQSRRKRGEVQGRDKKAKEYETPKEETRKIRDQQLRQLAKLLKPHDIRPHE